MSCRYLKKKIPLPQKPEPILHFQVCSTPFFPIRKNTFYYFISLLILISHRLDFFKLNIDFLPPPTRYMFHFFLLVQSSSTNIIITPTANKDNRVRIIQPLNRHQPWGENGESIKLKVKFSSGFTDIILDSMGL